MRIYTRKAFLALPAGTIYAAGKPWVFGSLAIKADTLPYNDFVCLHPTWVDAQDSTEATDRLEAMLRDGASYPMEESFGRDGGFDNEEIYLVYERADLERLRG